MNHNLSQDSEAEVRAKISEQNFGEVFKIEIWSTCDLTEKPLLRALNSWVCCAFGNDFTNSSELCKSYQTKIPWRRFDIDGMVRRRCTRIGWHCILKGAVHKRRHHLMGRGGRPEDKE